MASEEEERIVMTPKKKTANSTTLIMERKIIYSQGDRNNKMHVAGGNNAGIVINKEQSDHDDISVPAHLCLEFRVFLVNVNTKRYTQEKRILSFWFKDVLEETSRAYFAQEFFKTLVSPTDFPRDYVGFIKKILKLMQKEYPMMSKVEVQLTQEKEMNQLPNKPSDEEAKKREEIKPEDLLQSIEEAYPNSLTVDDMSRRFKVEKELIKNMVMELLTRQLVKPVGVGGYSGGDSGATAYRRVHQNEDQVTVVKQMPRVERALQPTIAVITSQYQEKMAVDAVMSNKQTFVRYATNGEANVYTLGDLGSHRVVTTKLPMTGHTRDALIATGSTTTRLLGTFQDVEHVFLVGVGGAVPHFTDFDKHVRLGDVVISAPPSEKERFIYQYCEAGTSASNGDLKFECRSWCPVDLGLQTIAKDIVEKYENNPSEAPWIRHFEEALRELGSTGWERPSGESDKLYMSVGGGDLIEVGHPLPREGKEDPRAFGEPLLHLGPVAAGRLIARDESLRQELARRLHVRCFDTELDAVVESIYGNRKDQYMLIRGIADYVDGTREKEWQQYASLMAAAVLRTVVEAMPPPPEGGCVS